MKKMVDMDTGEYTEPVGVIVKSTPNEAGRVVGIISEKHGVVWVVSPHRKDQRHGSVSTMPLMSDYGNELFALVSFYGR